MSQPLTCYCGSNLTFSTCCEPLLLGKSEALSAEALMRSRYTAYALKRYPYILATYASLYRDQLTTQELMESSAHTRWLRLEVISSHQMSLTATVEFKAYYSIESDFYLMHELSEFILEDDCWRYTRGKVMPETSLIKLGRNDLCLCGSNKKFKKCCAK